MGHGSRMVQGQNENKCMKTAWLSSHLSTVLRFLPSTERAHTYQTHLVRPPRPMPTAKDRRRFATLEQHLSLPLVGYYGKFLIGRFRDLGWQENKPVFAPYSKKTRKQVSQVIHIPLHLRARIQNTDGCLD